MGRDSSTLYVLRSLDRSRSIIILLSDAQGIFEDGSMTLGLIREFSSDKLLGAIAKALGHRMNDTSLSHIST